MTVPRALIAEDEPILAQTLQLALHRLWPQLQILSVVGDGAAAVRDTLTLRPDIIFLDIKMPVLTGLDAARELAEEWPDDTAFPLIVFVTAYEEFAREAFDHAAADYLCKPISDERLGKTVQRLHQRLAQRSGELDRIVQQLRTIVPVATAGTSPPLRLLRAAVGNQVRMIPLAEVMYLEAADKYLRIVCRNSEALIRLSVKELLPQLDQAQFWQIHRGTVVNVDYIDLAQRDDYGKLSLRLRGRPEHLAVSRLFAHLFRQM